MKLNAITYMTKIFVLIILIIMGISTNIMSYDITEDGIQLALIDPDDFEPDGDLTEYDKVIQTGGIIVDVIRTIGLIVSVISILLLGLKYMTGTISEKAGYKKSMIPYLIGIMIFFSLSVILTTIIEVISGIKT